MEKILQRCPLFRGLKAEYIESVLKKYHHFVRSYQEKEFVILQEDTCENLMIVAEGVVQTQMIDPMGKLIIIEELGTPQLLAPAFIFPDINRMPVSVFVLKPAKILYFRKQTLLRMMQEDQNILLNFLNITANRSCFLSQKLKFHAFMSIKDKISYYLMEEYRKYKSLRFRLEHTQQEFADMFGVARPSLARTFSKMEKSGIISIEKKNVTILDLDKLRTF
jgi:CRP-like cAMP-binding protein